MSCPSIRSLIPVLLLISAAHGWDQQAELNEAIACGQTKTPVKCAVTKDVLDEARDEFARGLKLNRAGKTSEALEAFQTASYLVPRDLEYTSAREIARQQTVMADIERGNTLLSQKRMVEAAAAFRQAIEIDSSNSYAREQLRLAMASPPAQELELRIEDGPSVVRARPAPGKKGFHFEGDSRHLLEEVAAAFGLHATLAESVQTRQVKLDIEEVDFITAMEVAGELTKTFWVPLAQQEILVAGDTKDQHDQFDRMVLRTFYLPYATAAAQLNDMVNALRTIFEIRLVVPQPASNSIAVRAPRALVDAATRFLETLDVGRPQVMLEMQVFEVSRSTVRSLGMNLPLQWQAFNVGQEALGLLQQPNIQDLINQLFSSGDINQANSTAITALLGQLQSQQTSLLSQPFATFGGGSTLMAIPFAPATASFSRNESLVRLLQRLTVRAGHGDPATIRIGSRYPILNTTFAPIFNSGALSQVIQGGGFTAPFPSFSYEDLGITVKATPQVHSGEVTLTLEIDIKSLGAQSFNGVPVIANRSYRGAIRVKDGEAAVVAGTLDRQEQRSLSGPPGVGALPGVGRLFSTSNKQLTESELLIVITPTTVGLPPSTGQAVVLRAAP